MIGMESMVTHDVNLYEIWTGNPTRKIRNKLFNKMAAQVFIKSEW